MKKTINGNLYVKVQENKEAFIEKAGLILPSEVASEDFEIGEVLVPDDKGEFKVGDKIAFEGWGIIYDQGVIIKKHQILFIDEQ